MQFNGGKVFHADEKYFEVSAEDKKILRELAYKVADIASLPEIQKRREMWYRHNELKKGEPLLLVFPENSWNELLPQSSLKTKSRLARNIEWDLLSRIYSYENFHDDKPLEARIGVDLFIDDQGYGILAERTYTGDENGSAHFEPMIKNFNDLCRSRAAEWGKV